ncbi:hypothetical protein INR49_028826 [Caranx melampygus]|nr:hypothetical protein INR49_028826 [Caranx melampygus]
MRGCELTEDAMVSLLEATQHKVLLQELPLVYEESGDFDQTALALSTSGFSISTSGGSGMRKMKMMTLTTLFAVWELVSDCEYFLCPCDSLVQMSVPSNESCLCISPLSYYYDILETECQWAWWQSTILTGECSQCFQQFSVLRSGLSTDSTLSWTTCPGGGSEAVRPAGDLQTQTAHHREPPAQLGYSPHHPLSRYVLAYKGNARQQCVQSRGPRESGLKVATCHRPLQHHAAPVPPQCKLLPMCSTGDTEIMFHREPVSAVESSHQGDVVIVLPGVYTVNSSIFIPDSITVEGVRQGTLNMENCVLQCETTGVIVRTSARLNMNMCDLYGSKVSAVLLTVLVQPLISWQQALKVSSHVAVLCAGGWCGDLPRSVCSLVSNGIHHCKDGILIKDFADELDVMPSITMENNVIHNNECYGVILVKPNGEQKLLRTR